MDPEQHPVVERQLTNTTVHNITWRGVTVTVNDRKSKHPSTIVDNVEGIVKAGECCAVMGPSGSGKTTLLNVLARRPAKARSIEGTILINGGYMPDSDFRQISSFVEQQEAFIGGLTVFETLVFPSQLACSRSLASNRLVEINGLLESFGLADHADALIGTSLRKGISDGQRRRVAVARQLVTSPKVLFLDEPTSGLDSAASFEVIHYLRALARRNNLIVIFSIHQPSSSIFNLFDKLLLVSAGKPHYFGAVSDVVGHYKDAGIDIPRHSNIADFLLELVNIDFSPDKVVAARRLGELQSTWEASTGARMVHDTILCAESASSCLNIEAGNRPRLSSRTVTLLYRSFVKSYRDPMAYAIRLTFAMSFAILIGTVWLHLDHDQESIESFISEIYFSLCFMSVAAIIYGPAFMEDYLQFIQDFQNGLYGATEFVLSNFFIGIPYTFFTSLMFTIVCYWLSGLSSSFVAFCTWVLWIFLTSLAAEALVVFVVSIFPDFMFTIACASFLNSLLLCTQGFFISYSSLSAFYKYGFHYWNYLAYSFQGLMVNQFSGAVYSCGDNCSCVYVSDLASRCQISGDAILDRYGYKQSGNLGRDASIVIAITFGYRLASWILIKLKN